MPSATSDQDQQMTEAETQTPADLLDEEWLAAPSRRSRLRAALVVLLAAALVFLAGVEVQRRYGAASSAADSAATPSFPRGGLPTGFPGGGPQGIQSVPTASATSGSADQASVIGTVESVKGDVWTIKDLGGKVHKVTVDTTVRIVRETSVDAADVVAGATVDVTGTSGADGAVTATTITLR